MTIASFTAISRNHGGVFRRIARCVLGISFTFFALCVFPVQEAWSQAALANQSPPVDRSDELTWEPEFDFGFGVLSQSHDGEASASLEGGQQLFRDSGDSIISTFFNFGLSVYSPFQLDVPTKPRLVFNVGFQLPIAEGLVANRNDTNLDPSDAAFADGCPPFILDANGDVVLIDPQGPPVGVFDTPLVPDTCSTAIRNRTTPNVMWLAGFGVDFTLPIDEEQFHLRPSLDYIGLLVQGEGSFLRRTSSSNLAALIDNVEQIDVIGESEVFHGISPSIRLAIDAYEEGPWTWQVYVSGRVAYFFDTEDLRSTGQTPLGEFGFLSEVDEFQYQAYAGITLRFNPNGR